jgi:hypothetical protein
LIVFLLLIALLMPAVFRGTLQRVTVYELSNAPPHVLARFLIESEMNPTIDTRVVDVFSDLLEARVLENLAGE